jgi:hypothetical protein
VNSHQLRPWQARQIRATLRPALGYLSRLKRRMENRGFPPDDKLYVAVAAAYDALYGLCVDLHYRSCETGVAKPSEPQNRRPK